MAVTIIVRRDKWVYDQNGMKGEATEAYGLSTDIVNGTIPSVRNPYNGMLFMAMDTQDVFMFDADSGSWLPQQ